jgi:Ni/Co efflux regulator RcnB
MKKTLLVAATVASLLAGFAASAQPYGGPYGDRDRDGRPNYAERGHGHDRDDRRDDRDRDDRDQHDNRYDGRHWGNRGHHYARGQRFEYYGRRDYIVNDYRRYGWAPPRRGYAYYRTDSGDVILAAIATGIIASVIAGNLN